MACATTRIRRCAGTHDAGRACCARGFRTGAFVGSVVLDPDRGLARASSSTAASCHAGRAPEPRGSAGRTRSSPTRCSWLDASVTRRSSCGRTFTTRTGRTIHRSRSVDALRPVRRRDRICRRADRTPAGSARRRQPARSHDRGRAGDHGESLGDHGERDHGIFLYESVLRVPLIVRAPACAGTGRRGRPAHRRHADRPRPLRPRAPTTDGVSLARACGPERMPDLEAYAESLYPSVSAGARYAPCGTADSRPSTPPARAVRPRARSVRRAQPLSGAARSLEPDGAAPRDARRQPFSCSTTLTSLRPVASDVRQRHLRRSATSHRRRVTPGESPAGAARTRRTVSVPTSPARMHHCPAPARGATRTKPAARRLCIHDKGDPLMNAKYSLAASLAAGTLLIAHLAAAQSMTRAPC